MTGYDLSRRWFEFIFENPHLVKPNHTALFFWIVEKWNRLGQVPKLGMPSEEAMHIMGIRNWRTYKTTFDDLVEFGFIIIIQSAKNQYSANIIAIVENTKAQQNHCSISVAASTKALHKHIQNQVQEHCSSTVGINKPQTTNHKPQTTNDDDVVPPPSSATVIMVNNQQPKPPPGFGVPPSIDFRDINECIEEYFNSPIHERTRDQLSMSKYMTVTQLKLWAETFNMFLTEEGKITKQMSDWMTHFRRWLNLQDLTEDPVTLLEKQKNRNDGLTKNGKQPGVDDYAADLLARANRLTGQSGTNGV